MGGFMNESLNIAFEEGVYKLIILHLNQCSCAMKRDCGVTGHRIFNNEDRITNRLVAEYLNKNTLGLKFIPQSMESFNPDTDTYYGRCDIQVGSANWFFGASNDYYLIECKRIDGGANLNREFVSEGVSRFVTDAPKYPSYHGRNLMFGYVVKAIDIPANTMKIEKYQANLLVTVQSGKLTLVDSENDEFYHYSCEYQSAVKSIELAHIFYDFSEIICDNQ